MASKAGLNCFKFLTILINFLFLGTGAVLIAIGAYAIADELSGLTSVTLAGLIIAVGCLVTLVSFLGCFGALRLNRGMLKAYSILVLIFVICEITAGSLAYVYRDEIPGLIDEAWTTMHNDTVNGQQTITDIQNQFNCCGYHNVTDRAVPEECSTMYERYDGCQAQVEESIEENFELIAITAIVIGALQLVCFIVSCCLICRIPTKEEQDAALLEESRQYNRETYSSTTQNPPINYTTTTVYRQV